MIKLYDTPIPYQCICPKSRKCGTLPKMQDAVSGKTSSVAQILFPTDIGVPTRTQSGDK